MWEPTEKIGVLTKADAVYLMFRSRSWQAQTEAAKRILALHTSPQEAGRVFSTAKPRLAVYAHISSAGGAAPQRAEYIAATRQTYNGPLEFGEDLMTINIGDAVTVERPAKK